MIKLSKGQASVLVATSLPMAAVGIAGAVATYVNMDNVLHRGASALGLVAAGEGATLVCALVALMVTLMGQHTPTPVRLGLWLVPLGASGVGLTLAPTTNDAVTMAFTPLAMTAAGEGVAFVARRVVAYRTGTDIEQQRRSGLLLWHANRAANGSGLGKRLSKAAVWRLTRSFAATDAQLSVQLGEIQRYRIGQGADENLAAVFMGATCTSMSSGALKGLHGAENSLAGGTKPVTPPPAPKAVEAPSQPSDVQAFTKALEAMADRDAERFGVYDRMTDELALIESEVAVDPDVKLLTTAEVAAMKGVKPGTVRSWKLRGILTPVMVDGRPMYRQLDVMDLD